MSQTKKAEQGAIQQEVTSQEQVLQLPINMLVEYAGHPFNVLDDDSMNELVQNVSKHGVATPIIVRKQGNGMYEITLIGRRKGFNMANVYITKTKYVQGVGCVKALWLNENKPEVAGEPEDLTAKEQGILAGELARDLFGSHETVVYCEDKQMMIDATRWYLNAKVPVICEASFGWEDTFCMVDILLNYGNGHVEIVEVKSSSGDKPEHIDDVAFQTWVLEKNGFKVDSAILMHINGTYIRRGDLDIHELFAPVDITDKVRAKLPGVNDNLRRIQEAIYRKAEPNIDFNLSCQKCVFWQYCSRNLPKPNVFDLPGTGSAFSYKHKLAKHAEILLPRHVRHGKSMAEID